MPRLDIRGAIFASRDPVALDALLSRLRGLDPLRDIPTLAEAHERRLGCGDVGKAKLVGEISIAEERWWWSDHSQKTSRGLLQRLRGRHLEAARLVYEDWVFHTGWGSLYRGYQRRAISYAAR
jgi:hypothetical protein